MLALAGTLQERGRLDQVEIHLRRALATYESAVGDGHPWVAESLRGLAGCYRQQQRPREAEELYQSALAIWEQFPGHPGTEGVAESYAALLEETGRPEDAARLEQRATAAGEAP